MQSFLLNNKKQLHFFIETVYYRYESKKDGGIMKGKIIKGIAGFYYVHANGVVYECKAKGVFRNRKIKPLVGDNVCGW